ncbi:MAG: transporter [Cytophagaceae bacterium]|nr:transporter [Cytophagaceae bacterium]
MNYYYIILLFIFTNVAVAQDTTVVFDRPGIADGPYLVRKKCIQLESGFAYSKYTGINNALAPFIMLRKSFFKRNEIRIGFNYQPQTLKIIDYNLKNNFIPIAIGIKQKLFREKKVIPEASLIINTFYPSQKIGRQANLNYLNLETVFQFQNNINKYFSLNYNAGLLFNQNNKRKNLFYAFCINWNVHPSITFFGEGFGYMNTNVKRQEYGLDGGIIINLKKRNQLDISYITNFYEGNKYYWISIGFSTLINY